MPIATPLRRLAPLWLTPAVAAAFIPAASASTANPEATTPLAQLYAPPIVLFDMPKKPAHPRFVVLARFDRALPSFGKGRSLAAGARLQGVKGSVNLGGDSGSWGFSQISSAVRRKRWCYIQVSSAWGSPGNPALLRKPVAGRHVRVTINRRGESAPIEATATLRAAHLDADGYPASTRVQHQLGCGS